MAKAEARIFPVVIVLLSGATLVGCAAIFIAGRDYYFASSASRLDHPQHALFAATGTIGIGCGIAATVLFLSNLFYLVRKKARIELLGTMRHWLRWHVISGTLGCLLVALHAVFEARTLVTQAIVWSLVVVIVTGVVGRYLVRFIPRTRDGQQQVVAELEDQVMHFIETVRPACKDDTEALAVLNRMADALDSSQALPGLGAAMKRARTARRELRYLARTAGAEGALPSGANLGKLMRDAGKLYRQLLLARFASNLLDSWRIFHRVLALLFIVALGLHIGAALYYGFVSL
ncbi:MAG: hypothetical protein KC503_13510 [Myxococcales bacterium]|nr:hypothetical protein [Myxococcales bacterium]